MGLAAGLDDMEKWKVLTLPGPELEPLGRPAVACSYSDFFLHFLFNDAV
jgi:hypothetical protein